MERVITLTDNQVSFIGGAIQSEQLELAKEIKELRAKLQQKEKHYADNENTLIELGLRTNDQRSDKPFVQYHSLFKLPENKKSILYDYAPNLSIWKKICFILNRENKVFTGRELIEEIYNREPELRNIPKEMNKQFEDNVFAVLSKETKDGELIRFKPNGEGQYKYGFKDWFENGEIKKEYLI
jgi:hypothetical protein